MIFVLISKFWYWATEWILIICSFLLILGCVHTSGGMWIMHRKAFVGPSRVAESHYLLDMFSARWSEKDDLDMATYRWTLVVDVSSGYQRSSWSSWGLPRGPQLTCRFPISLSPWRGPFPNIREFKHSNTNFFCLKTVPIVCTHVECTQGCRNISLIGWVGGHLTSE